MPERPSSISFPWVANCHLDTPTLVVKFVIENFLDQWWDGHLDPSILQFEPEGVFTLIWMIFYHMQLLGIIEALGMDLPQHRKEQAQMSWIKPSLFRASTPWSPAGYYMWVKFKLSMDLTLQDRLPFCWSCLSSSSRHMQEERMDAIINKCHGQVALKWWLALLHDLLWLWLSSVATHETLGLERDPHSEWVSLWAKVL